MGKKKRSRGEGLIGGVGRKHWTSMIFFPSYCMLSSSWRRSWFSDVMTFKPDLLLGCLRRCVVLA